MRIFKIDSYHLLRPIYKRRSSGKCCRPMIRNRVFAHLPFQGCRGIFIADALNNPSSQPIVKQTGINAVLQVSNLVETANDT